MLEVVARAGDEEGPLPRASTEAASRPFTVCEPVKKNKNKKYNVTATLAIVQVDFVGYLG